MESKERLSERRYGPDLGKSAPESDPADLALVVLRSAVASAVGAMLIALDGPIMIGAGKYLDQKKANRIGSWLVQNAWAIPVLKMANIRLDIEGLSHLQKDRAQIIVSNHEGFLDHLAIPAALAQKGIGMSFVAKRKFLKYPLLGRAIESLGVPTIDPENVKESMRILKSATQTVKENNINVVWFPEGTRSKDGSLGEFMNGFAYMAINSGSSVVPVCLKGSYECMPKGSMLSKPGTISVQFGAPIETTGMSSKKRENISSLVENTRRIIAEMKGESGD
jgi:1-acyl-sn-glycerol-3-phosphate acyltransferase